MVVIIIRRNVLRVIGIPSFVSNQQDIVSFPLLIFAFKRSSRSIGARHGDIVQASKRLVDSQYIIDCAMLSVPFYYIHDWLIDCILLYVPYENIKLTWIRHHCPWRAVLFRVLLGAYSFWARKIFIVPYTMGLEFCCVIWSFFIWQARGIEVPFYPVSPCDSILHITRWYIIYRSKIVILKV